MQTSTKLLTPFVFGFALTAIAPARAVVLYEEGRQFINGVVLLRDKEDPTAYFYLPTFPRVSLNEAGKPEMYIVKFEGKPLPAAGQAQPQPQNGPPSGGLLHFLFTLDLPAAQVEELDKELKKKVSGASIRGPVPLLVDRPLEQNEDGPKASFRIISGVLNEANGVFKSTVISSGVAPVTPGSKAAVAAVLDRYGATLLFDSLEGRQGASDVSVSITAYYEAAVTGFNGTVNADLSTVYDYMLRLNNRQHEYTKVEISDTVDSLVRNGLIEVEVTDRAGLNINTSSSEAMLDLITNKLIEMLFDTTQGLSALPEPEKAPVLEGREERSFFAQVFGGHDQPKYISDNRFMLKDRTDIRRGTFSLRFTRNTTIKVPYDSSGNIRRIYDEYRSESDIIRTVDMDDPSFRRRPIHFQVEPEFYDQFGKTITSASIAVRKSYTVPGQADFTGAVLFRASDLSDGEIEKSVEYPYLGITDPTADAFQYRTVWNFVGGGVLTMPASADGYLTSRDYGVVISPPVEITALEVEIDRPKMESASMRRAEVQLRFRLLGKSETKNVGLHVTRGPDLLAVSVLHDPGTTPERRIVWTGDNTQVTCEAWQPLEQNYILVNALETDATAEACR